MCGEKFRPFATMFESKWITPACAGKSDLLAPAKRELLDHPRMCGEKRIAMGITATRLGSPPHVRGKAFHSFLPVLQGGITPACAGKRSTPKYPVMDDRDHPRMCGEKFLLHIRQHICMGSPPHVRGKEKLRNLTGRHPRITPACAGKSRGPCTGRSLPWDHPRMCGEKVDGTTVIDIDKGSPPHVRGKEQGRTLYVPS